MTHRFGLFVFSAFIGFILVSSPLHAEVTAEKADGKVVIQVDGKPFATYLTQSGTKPCIWPIIGPTGKAMTRQYPLGPIQETERKDHIHHRSLWFTHGDVNGLDFWAERAKGSRQWENRD